MITLDLGAALAESAREACAAGDLPGVGPEAAATGAAGAARRTAEGHAAAARRRVARDLGAEVTGSTAAPWACWRPVPSAAGGGPGVYGTAAAFRMARRAGLIPVAVAEILAARMRPRPWVQDAAVTGGGHLTVAVTPDALAVIAVRVTAAGPECARSDALAGVCVAAPRGVDLRAAPTWGAARRLVSAEVTGRLAEAAGAMVTRVPAERLAPGDSSAGDVSRPGPGAQDGPVAGAVAFAGPGPVRLALCRLSPGRPVAVAPETVAARCPANPAYAVQCAHAQAASVLRHAARLGVSRGGEDGFQPRLLSHPRERALLDAMSWMPERVAGAARRGQPHEFARYLERLAATYLDCHEACPAVPPGVAPAAGPLATAGGRQRESVVAARLWLAAAARTALAAGLGLLGVDAPGRL